MKRSVILGLTAAIILFSASIAGTAPQKKVAYITIDDGPTLNTPRIMDALKRHNAGAVFFVLKDRIEAYPDYIRMMEYEGFAIGLHGESHSIDIYSEPTRPLLEMNRTNEALYSLLGRKSDLVRTPYGSRGNLSQRQRQLLETSGFKIIDWNVDPRDSVGKVIDKDQVLRNLKAGLDSAGTPAIVLLHDRKSTADNMDQLLSLIEAAGYTMETLTGDEL